jgi:hypothetical protein
VQVITMTAARTSVSKRILGAILAASAMTGLIWALLAWSTTVTLSDGSVCATAFHYHPGFGYLSHGGELSDADRRAAADVCDRAGARPWHTGWVALRTGLSIAAVCGVGLVAVGRRRPRTM